MFIGFRCLSVAMFKILTATPYRDAEKKQRRSIEW